MTGCMRRGEAWELRVFLGADPVTGKKRYVTKTVRGGKREGDIIGGVIEFPRGEAS